MFDLFSEMRSQARKKAINVSDQFADLDTHYEGKLSKLKFRRAFDSLDVRIDDQTFKEIASIYALEDRKVDYRRFLKDFEASATTKKILTNDELREFAKPLLDRNRTLSEILRDSDKFHNGRVPYDTFVLVFGPSTLTKTVADCYTTPPFNEVTYIELEHDIERALNTEPDHTDPLARAPPFFMDMARTMQIKGIDPYLVLSAHDKFKKRTILTVHFLSDMTSMGFTLTPEQMQDLTDAFSENGRFKYIDFCDAVNEAQRINVEQTLRREEELTLSQPQPTVDVAETLKQVEKEVVDRHSQLDRAFEQFDLEGEGKLPASAFRATLENNQFRSLGREELDAVCDEFVDNDNMVNYKAFVMAVTPPPKSAKKETDDIIERLRRYLETKGLRIKPLMQKLDSERKGTIAWTQLLAVFRNIQFDINIRERRLLRSRTTYQVNIEELSGLVDPPPVENVPERFEEEEEEEEEAPPRDVLEALARLASVIEREDVDVMAEFRRYEAAPTGFVRSATFEAVIRRISSLIDSSDIDVLLNHYKDPQRGKVDGYKFERHLRTFGKDQLILDPSLTISMVVEERTIDEETRKIMRRLKAHLASRSLNGYELFKVYDTQKTGYIPKNRLNRVLSFIEFEATPSEIERLGKAFEAQKMPEKINYKKLVVAVDSETVTDSDLASTMVRRSLTNSGEWKLISVLNLIHNKLRDRRKTAQMAFVGLPDEPISVDEFKSRVATFGILIPTADLQCVIKKYRTNLRGDIDWRSFCDDLDSMKTVQAPR